MGCASPSMIGRQSDLDALRSEFERTLAGEPRAVVLGGEAGIGKTRLVSEFAASIRSDATVLFGACVDLGTDSAPYAPFTGILRGLITALSSEGLAGEPDAHVVSDARAGSRAPGAHGRHTPALVDGRARLLEAAGAGQAVLPVLLPELASGVDVPERTGAERLYELVAVLLETFSREHPLVLVIEDIHWADAATLELVRFLVRMLASSRVLLVMTYRSDEVRRGHPLRAQLPELERTRRLVRWDLERLTRGEVAAQLTAIHGEAPSATTLASVFSRSEGVPFFVEELADVDGESMDVLPETLRDLLLARYERLSEPTQLLLRLLSAGGVCVQHELLSAVFDGTPDALDSAAREAVFANLLTVNGTEYEFRHALVREAIHDDLLPGERTRFHGRYAAAIEQRAAAGSSARSSISYHWMMAHDLERAFPATLQAMSEATASYAYALAARMGERALELWDQVPDAATVGGTEHAELLRKTAVAFRDAGDSDRALALTNAALDEWGEGEAAFRARLLRDKAQYTASLSRRGATALLEEALELIPEGTDDQLRALTLSDLSARYMLEAEFDRAISTATRALEASTAVGAVGRMSVSHNIRGVALVGIGRIEEGLVDLEKAGELAAGNDGALLRYRVNASDVMFLLGRYEDAIRLGEAGARRARELGVERTSGAMLFSNTVEALIGLGNWDRAEELLDPALALDAPPGFRLHLRRMKLWLTLWRGDPAAAAELLSQWRPGMMVRSEMQSRLGVGRIEAEIALANGDLDAAWHAATVLLSDEHRLMHGYDLPLLTVAARVLAELRASDRMGEPDASTAEAALRGVLEYSKDWPTATVWAPLFEAELAGTGTGALQAWNRAADAAANPLAPAHLRPYALYRASLAHLAQGDRRAAEDRARDARDAARTLGAGLILDAVDALAARAGFDPSRGGASGPADREGVGVGTSGAADAVVRLTERERQVLELIGQGFSNGQIGQELFISTKTASVHVSAILRKLGASSRTEAVYLARSAAAAEPAR